MPSGREPSSRSSSHARWCKLRINRRALIAVLGLLPFLAACRQDMHDSPRYRPYRASAFYADGSSARNLVEGTIPRGFLRDDDWLYTGRVNGQLVSEFPFAIAAADLDR